MTDLHDWTPAGANTSIMFDDDTPRRARCPRNARTVAP
jgi:hypothetical protein